MKRGREKERERGSEERERKGGVKRGRGRVKRGREGGRGKEKE